VKDELPRFFEKHLQDKHLHDPGLMAPSPKTVDQIAIVTN
jgi:hypothetical protein